MKKLPDFLKPLKRGDTLRTVYLYKDSHAVAYFERYDRDTGKKGRYVKVAAPGLVEVSGKWTRLFFNAGLARLIFTLPGKARVSAYPESLDNGSDKTKGRGIAVALLSLESDLGWINFHSTPSLVIDDYTIQTEEYAAETWESLAGKETYGDENIVNRDVLPTTAIAV